MYYLGFTPDTGSESARSAFKEKYGRYPFELIRSKGCVLAGPIPDQNQPPVDQDEFKDLPLFSNLL